MMKGGRKISMKDIAAELNISITTVSFVVNGKSEQKNISPATVKKVNDLVEKRGYNPNSAARLLRTGRSKTIGLIVEDIGNFFFANIAKTVGQAAHRSGYNVILSSTENNDATARDLINKMKNNSVDGFIITATHGLVHDISKLKKEHIPFVLIDRVVPEVQTNFVILDNYIGGFNLTTHLVSNGYTKIGMISMFSEMSNVIDRERGFMKAMQAAKLKVPASKVLKFAFGEKRRNIIPGIQHYLEQNKDIEAVFFTTNDLGVLGIEAIQESKIKIPEEIAVVSFDDNDLFRLHSPSITVAAQPIKEIATRAIELLIKLINGESDPEKMTEIVVEPKIIIRSSSPRREKKTPGKHYSLK